MPDYPDPPLSLSWNELSKLIGLRWKTTSVEVMQKIFSTFFLYFMTSS